MAVFAAVSAWLAHLGQLVVAFLVQCVQMVSSRLPVNANASRAKMDTRV
jgi:hypothetical protein